MFHIDIAFWLKWTGSVSVISVKFTLQWILENVFGIFCEIWYVFKKPALYFMFWITLVVIHQMRGVILLSSFVCLLWWCWLFYIACLMMMFTFYCTKHSVARYCHDKLSVCPSVCNVGGLDYDHTRWNSAKVITRMISLGTWLSADPIITDLLQREHP